MPTFRRPNGAGSSGLTPRGIHPTARIGENFREIDSSVGKDCIIEDSVYLKYVDVGQASIVGYHSTITGDPKARIVIPECTVLTEGTWIMPRDGFDFYDLGDDNYAYTAKTRDGKFQAIVNLDGIEIKGDPYGHDGFPIGAIRIILDEYGIIFNPNAIDTTATPTPPGGPALGHGQ